MIHDTQSAIISQKQVLMLNYMSCRKAFVVITERAHCFHDNIYNLGKMGKMYLLPKIHKRLFNVSGRPVISNCGSPTEKISEFLDSHIKNIMRESWSYIKDSNDFIKKNKELKGHSSGRTFSNGSCCRIIPCRNTFLMKLD